jgi:surface antigen
MANVPASRVLAVARKEIGYREGRNNDTKYGRWYPMNHNAWCAMFVSWVASQAGASNIIPKHAWTPSGAQWFKDRGRYNKTPKKGAIVYFFWPSMGRIAHVGIVEAVKADGSIVTIEGNTSPNGGRTGDGVYRLVRRANIDGFGHPDYGPEPKPKPVAKMPVVSLAVMRRVALTGKVKAGDRAHVKLVKEALYKKKLIAKAWTLTTNFSKGNRAAYASYQRSKGFRGRDADGIPGVSTLTSLGKETGVFKVGK